MKKYAHTETGRVVWAMRVTEQMFLPDAARPESEGLEYDPQLHMVTAFATDHADSRSSGGVGAWVVEVVPGSFEVMPHEAFSADYREWRAGPAPRSSDAPSAAHDAG